MQLSGEALAVGVVLLERRRSVAGLCQQRYAGVQRLVLQRLQLRPAYGSREGGRWIAGAQPRLHDLAEGAPCESGEVRSSSRSPIVELRRPRQRELVEEWAPVKLDNLFPLLLLRRRFKLSGVEGAAFAGGVHRIPRHLHALLVQVAAQRVERLREGVASPLLAPLGPEEGEEAITVYGTFQRQVDE